MKLDDTEGTMYQCKCEHGYAKVPAIVQQGEKFFIQPAYRANSKDKMQQQHGKSGGAPDQQGFESYLFIED